MGRSAHAHTRTHVMQKKTKNKFNRAFLFYIEKRKIVKLKKNFHLKNFLLSSS